MKRLLAILLSVLMLMTSMLSFSSVFAVTIDDTNDDWIHCVGSKYYDMYGNEVRLTGANWFGFNCSERVLHGLWQVDMRKTLKSIADHGINLLRIPVSTELLYEWKTGNAKSVNIQVNPWGDVNTELEGMNSMQIFDRMVEICKEYGIKIMVDVHSPDANNSGHNYALWYGKEMSNGVMCTTDIWIDTWVWLVDKYKNDDTIIACDLENEPHGQPGESAVAKWDNSTDENNWKYAAERCANAILDVNPNLLIMIEGIEAYPKTGTSYASTNKSDYIFAWWGGSLRGVRDNPVKVKSSYQSQIVYSPHDYGPKVFKQTWFNKDFTKQTLMDDYWYDTWAYITEENIAPLLIGEWGGFMDGDKNERWMQIIADYIAEKGLSHTFWCINANSGDTGGLLDNSWTAWEEDKYALFKPTLWQDTNGKFIGLDHKVVLGDNGILITDFYEEGGIPYVPPKQPDTDIDTNTDTDTEVNSDTNEDTDTDISTDTESDLPIVSIVIYEGNAPLGTWNNQYECDVKSVPNATIDGWLTITGVLDSDPQIQIAAKIGEEYKWTEIFNAQRLTDTNTIVPLTEQQALLLATANELDFQGQNATITKIVYSYVDKSNQDIVTDTDTDTDTNSDTDTDTDTNTDKPRFILGDVNLDGVLDIIDVVLTRSHIVKSRPLTYLDADAPNRADMNGDYIVDIVDVVLMRKSIISKS